MERSFRFRTPSPTPVLRAASMFRVLALGLTCLLPNGVAAAQPPGSNDEVAVFFESEVRPLLVERCLECHGPDAQEGGLRLDSREAILSGGESGHPAAKPGQPGESRLIGAIRREGDLHMPPEFELPREEQQALVRWVELGLPWPEATPLNEGLTREQRFEQIRQTHWSLQPVEEPRLPEVVDAAWLRTGVDAFVLQNLEAHGLTPSAAADRTTLIRRLSYDLLGMPPSPAEVEAFVRDPAPDAYERLVERLLASPRYGERWGRHWLDVARYADTRGYAFGRERRYPYAYTYRDYVIDAWNEDLPYDRFLLEQLSADLLPDVDHRNGRQLAALGLLTVGRRFNNRHDDIDDQIDVIGRGLLGLSVACARCHDHKYDAIPTEDYYSLYGILASSKEPPELPLIGNPESTPGYDAFAEGLAERRAALESFRQEKLGELLEVTRSNSTDYLARVVTRQPEALLQHLPFISLSREDLKPKLVQSWRQYLLERASPDDAWWGLLAELAVVSEEEFEGAARAARERRLSLPRGLEAGHTHPRLAAALEQETIEQKVDLARLYGSLLSEAYDEWKEAGRDLEALPPDARLLAAVLVAPDSPTVVRVDNLLDYLTREDRNRYRELEREVDRFQVQSPGAPPRAMVVREDDPLHDPVVFVRGNHARRGERVPRQFLDVLAGEQRGPYTQGSGRLQLAHDIASAENPLTARVMVNRVWMHHFGRPLVATPSDFGVRCDPPPQRELLDYLAWELVEGGWSLKRLHRLMVLSATYRQQSLDRAECRSVDPENQWWWRMHRRRLEVEAMRDALFAVSGDLDLTMGGKPVTMFQGSQARRRAVYGFLDRQDLPSVLRVFDFANPDQSSARRPQTTVPQQSLFLMNSETVMERARRLVERPDVASLEAAEDRIERLYRILFARSPEPREVRIGLDYLNQEREASPDGDYWPRYAHLLMLANEMYFID